MVDKTDEEKRKEAARQRRIVAAENRKKAVDMRRGGATFQQIADTLGMSRQAAHKTVQRALDDLTAATERDAERLRVQELDRLDHLLSAAWIPARNGSHLHMAEARRIMERKAKLEGYNPPDKFAPTDPTGSLPYSPPQRDMTPEEREARIKELLALEADDDGHAE